MQPYIEGVKQLDAFGVDFIAMVCNTIHLYYDQLQASVTTPILDLREEVETKLRHGRVRRIFTVGTPNTIRQGLYQFSGIETLTPSCEDIDELSDAIYNFNIGNDQDRQRARTEEIARRYLDQGAECIVLGCTEFAVMLKDSDLPTLNTIDVLVEAVARKCVAGK